MWSTFLIFACALSSCRAFTLFDEEKYHSALDPVMCARQLETIDKSTFYKSSFGSQLYRIQLGGNLGNYGNFHQCLAINQDFPGRNIEGKYCLIRAPVSSPTIRIPSLGGVSDSGNITWTELTLTRANASRVIPPSALRLALCVPSTCTVDALLRPFAEHPHVRFNYSLESCRLPADIPFVLSDYVVFLILTLLGLLTIIGTSYELRYIYHLKKEPAKANELLRAWSLHANTSRLLTFQGAPMNLDCLDGIRALSVLWIVFFHSAYRMLENITNQAEIIYSAVHRQKYLWVFMGQIAVDSFFVLSGLLLVYTTAHKVKSMTLRNLPLFYLNRYMRLFPLLALMVLLQSSVMYRLFDGPLQIDNVKAVKRCRTYWWSALLHVQNIVNPEHMCLVHSWYLSVDMQLYVVSPLVLCWVLRRPRAAWCALTVAVLISLATALASSFYYNIPHNWMQSDIAPLGFWHRYYYNLLTRSPPFFIGMVFGYVLHLYRNDKLHLSKWSVTLCYILALVSSSVAIFQEHPSFDNIWEIHRVAVNINYALYRSCWALAVCWLILACAHGYGGPVNWFLSLKLWRFVSRISYAMYLVSYTLQRAAAASAGQSYFDTQSLLWRYAGDLTWTVALALAAWLVVDAPVTTLYNMLLKKIRSRDNEKQSTCRDHS